MRFQTLAIAVLTGSAAAQSWQGAENLLDGPCSGVVHANGSTTMTHLEHGTTHFFELGESQEKRQEIRALAQRESHCWGYTINHGSVDGSYDSLQRWAGNGQTLSSGDTTRYYGFNNQGVYSYACVNGPHKTYTFSRNDIRYALESMDGQHGKACQVYEAGYYIWPGTISLVGSCNSGSAVCLG